MKHHYLLSLLCFGFASTSTFAQVQTPANYPNKPVKLVVGFAPGGAADYVARNISDAMGKALGQSIIVENKAGAGSSIAAGRFGS
jgi:tripartite-type tricarboxylate transporter receptor subunit TctC